MIKGKFLTAAVVKMATIPPAYASGMPPVSQIKERPAPPAPLNVKPVIAVAPPVKETPKA